MATNKQQFSLLRDLTSLAVDKFDVKKIYQVDKSKTPKIYNDIVDDVAYLVEGGLFILIDGTDRQVKFADGVKLWSEATELGGGATPTATVRGGVLQQSAIADLTAPPTEVEINAILSALRASGILAV